MSKTFELSNNYSYAKITWSEVNDFASNSSIVSIDSLEIKTKSYYGVTYYPKGTIKVNGATVIAFDSAVGSHSTYISKAGTYYKVLANSAEYASAPWKTGAITHNMDGTKDIIITVDIALYAVGGGYASGQRLSGSITEALTALPKCAYFVSAPNFTDEENPTINYYNPIGESAKAVYACISFNGGRDDIQYREIDKLGTSYTFVLTEDERKYLLQNTQGSNSRTIRFELMTLTEDNKYLIKYMEKQFTVVDCLPIITPNIYDCNPDTLNLTDDESTFIKYHSNALVSFGANAQKEATIVSYSAICGNEELTVDNGVFNNIENNIITLTVIDSRGNRAQFEAELAMLNYFAPTCNVDAEISMDGETTAAVTMEVSGIVYDNGFIATENEINFYYRYKVNKGEFGDWIETKAISFEIEESTYKATLVCADLHYLDGYTFQVMILDSLDSAESGETKHLKLIPVFDWSAEDFNFNCLVKINGVSLIDIFYPKGAIYFSTKQDNPADFMGGTWEEIETSLEAYAFKRTK